MKVWSCLVYEAKCLRLWQVGLGSRIPTVLLMFYHIPMPQHTHTCRNDRNCNWYFYSSAIIVAKLQSFFIRALELLNHLILPSLRNLSALKSLYIIDNLMGINASNIYSLQWALEVATSTWLLFLTLKKVYSMRYHGLLVKSFPPLVY